MPGRTAVSCGMSIIPEQKIKRKGKNIVFTLEEVTNILDSDDYATIDGYNLIRTALLGLLSGVPAEFEERQAEINRLIKENERLKAANITLYDRVEKSIVNPAEPDGTPDEDQEPDYDKDLDDNVKSYMTD